MASNDWAKVRNEYFLCKIPRRKDLQMKKRGMNKSGMKEQEGKKSGIREHWGIREKCCLFTYVADMPNYFCSWNKCA